MLIFKHHSAKKFRFTLKLPKPLYTMMTYFYTSDMNLGIPKFSLKQNILSVDNNTISKI